MDVNECGWLMSLANQGGPDSWGRLDGLLKLFEGSRKRNGLYLMRDQVFGRVKGDRNPSPGEGVAFYISSRGKALGKPGIFALGTLRYINIPPGERKVIEIAVDVPIKIVEWLSANPIRRKLHPQLFQEIGVVPGPPYAYYYIKPKFWNRIQHMAARPTVIHSHNNGKPSKTGADSLTPTAADISKPPPRVSIEIYRVLRDTKLSRQIKVSHGFKCQVCHCPPLKLNDAKLYAEVHHIKPLGSWHNGPDIPENILCLCPNCHVLLDYGAIRLDLSRFRTFSRHMIGSEYVEYYNHRNFGKVVPA